MINDEYRHTSMIATLRKVWDLGDSFTARDAAARTFDHLLSRETPGDPASWPEVKPRPVPVSPRLQSCASVDQTAWRTITPANRRDPIGRHDHQRLSVGKHAVCRERQHALKRLEMPIFMHHHETVLLRDRGDQQVRQRDTMMKRTELGKVPLRRHRSPPHRGGDRDVAQRS